VSFVGFDDPTSYVPTSYVNCMFLSVCLNVRFFIAFCSLLYLFFFSFLGLN